MRVIRCLPFLLLAVVSVSTAEVFRWVDSDGQVHYSDRPQVGAERVEIRQPSTFQSPVVNRPRAGVEDDSEDDQSQSSYESLEIVSPSQEEVLWNIGGQLDVSMRVQPRLQRSHGLRLYLDDQLVERPEPRSLRARLSEVFRGVHVLRAEVVDANDRVLIQSQPVTFSVQQTSLLNPNNPNTQPPIP